MSRKIIAGFMLSVLLVAGLESSSLFIDVAKAAPVYVDTFAITAQEGVGNCILQNGKYSGSGSAPFTVASNGDYFVEITASTGAWWAIVETATFDPDVDIATQYLGYGDNSGFTVVNATLATGIDYTLITYFNGGYNAAASGKAICESFSFSAGFTLDLYYDFVPSASGIQALSQPQIGMISISTAQAQPVYESADGGVVRNADGKELWLPSDYDGNGFDTYLVLSSVDMDGTTWLEIFIGNGSANVWVPLDGVTVIE